MSNPTVLVVEDDPLQREGLRCLLEKEDYTVALSASPSEALVWLRHPPTPAVILLDMLFPRTRGDDGWRFLYHRQQNPDIREIPVVVLTALGNASEEWAKALGAEGYLRKPVDVDPLLAEVRRWCPGRSSH